MDRCPSRLTLHRLLHGELAGESELQTHVEGCERCGAWLEQTRAREQELERGLDLPRFAAGVAARGARDARAARRRGRIHLLAAAATVLLAVGITVLLWPRPPATTPETAIKGSSSLKIHCRRQGEVFELEPGDRVQGGDALRFEVFSETATHVLGLSVQADGRVSVYVPFDGQASRPLAPGRTHVLPGSVVLDAGGGDELLVFIFSKNPIAASAARHRARRALATAGRLSSIRRLDLPCDQELRLLRREKRWQ